MSKENNSLISIIVPYYNVSNYIGNCLYSIINQDYSNLEIILINDGSTDESLKNVIKYAESDSRIHNYNQENLGLSAARNKGISYANGEYITFIDGDDMVEKNYISCLYEAIKENNADIATAYMDRTDNIKFDIPIDIPKVSMGKESMNLLSENKILFNATCKLYKREIIRDLVFTNGMVYEDNYFVVKVIGKSHKVAICSQILYHHIIHEGSITQTKTAKNFIDKVRANMLVLQYIENYYEHNEIICVKRKIMSWSDIEYQFNDYYKEIMSKDEILHIENEQSKLRKNIVSDSYITEILKLSIKIKIKLLIIIFLPKLYYPLVKVYTKKRLTDDQKQT